MQTLKKIRTVPLTYTLATTAPALMVGAEAVRLLPTKGAVLALAALAAVMVRWIRSPAPGYGCLGDWIDALVREAYTAWQDRDQSGVKVWGEGFQIMEDS